MLLAAFVIWALFTRRQVSVQLTSTAPTGTISLHDRSSVGRIEMEADSAKLSGADLLAGRYHISDEHPFDRGLALRTQGPATVYADKRRQYTTAFALQSVTRFELIGRPGRSMMQMRTNGVTVAINWNDAFKLPHDVATRCSIMSTRGEYVGDTLTVVANGAQLFDGATKHEVVPFTGEIPVTLPLACARPSVEGSAAQTDTTSSLELSVIGQGKTALKASLATDSITIWNMPGELLVGTQDYSVGPLSELTIAGQSSVEIEPGETRIASRERARSVSLNGEQILPRRYVDLPALFGLFPLGVLVAWNLVVRAFQETGKNSQRARTRPKRRRDGFA